MYKKIIIFTLLILSLISSTNAFIYDSNPSSSDRILINYDFSQGGGDTLINKGGDSMPAQIKLGTWSFDNPSGNGFSLINPQIEIRKQNFKLNKNIGFSINAWFKPSSFSGTQDLIELYDVIGSGNILLRTSATTLTLFYITNNVQQSIVIPISNLNLNQWNQISITYDVINNIIKLYVNNVFKGSGVLSPNSIISDSWNLGTFGNFFNGLSQFFGKISNIKIVNKVYTINEINDLFNNIPQLNMELINYDGIFFKTNSSATFNISFEKPSKLSYKLDNGITNIYNSNLVQKTNLKLSGLTDGTHNITFFMDDNINTKSFTTNFEVRSNYINTPILTCPLSNIQDFKNYILDTNFIFDQSPCFLPPKDTTYIKIDGKNLNTLNLVHNSPNTIIVELNNNINGLEFTGFNIKNKINLLSPYKNSPYFIISRQGNVNSRNINIHDNYLDTIVLAYQLISNNLGTITKIYNLNFKNNAWHSQYNLLIDGKSFLDNLKIINNDFLSVFSNSLVSSFIQNNNNNPIEIWNSIFKNNVVYSADPTNSNNDFFNPINIRMPLLNINNSIVWENMNLMSSTNNFNNDILGTGITDSVITRQDKNGNIYFTGFEKTLVKAQSSILPNAKNIYFDNRKIVNNIFPQGSQVMKSSGNGDLTLNKKIDLFNDNINLDYGLRVSNLNSISPQFLVETNSIKLKSNSQLQDGRLNSRTYIDFFNVATRFASSGRNLNTFISFYDTVDNSIYSYKTPQGDIIPKGIISLNDNNKISGFEFRKTSDGNQNFIDIKSSTNANLKKTDNNEISQNVFYNLNPNSNKNFNMIRLTGDNSLIDRNYFYYGAGNNNNGTFLDLQGFNFSGNNNFIGNNALITSNFFYNRELGINSKVSIFKNPVQSVNLINNYIDNWNRGGINPSEVKLMANQQPTTGITLTGLIDIVYQNSIHTFNVGNQYEQYFHNTLNNCIDLNSNGFCDTSYNYDGVVDTCPLVSAPYDFINNIGVPASFIGNCGWQSSRPILNASLSLQLPIGNLATDTYLINNITPNIIINYTIVNQGESSLTCNLLVDDAILSTSNNALTGDIISTSYIPNLQGNHNAFATCRDKYNLVTTTQLKSFSVFIDGFIDLNPINSTLGGCTSQIATNYNVNATYNDGTCTFTTNNNNNNNNVNILGCTNTLATNYNSLANLEDGSCLFPINTNIVGCTNPLSINYNQYANNDSGTCITSQLNSQPQVNLATDVIDLNSVTNTNDNTISFISNIISFIVSIAVPFGILVSIIIVFIAIMRLIF